jgi:CheY-like chemotaxis protein
MNHTRILLVDDDQFIFADALDEIAKNVECVTANNGVEAIAYLNTANPIPSLIFLDLNMPFMNGFQCLEQIMKDDKLRHLPVIIYTTSDNPHRRKACKGIRCVIFFTKPRNFRLLKGKLLEILQMDFSKLQNVL